MKSKRKLKNTQRQITMKTHHTKSMGYRKAVLRGKFIIIQAVLKKIRKISNKQPNPPLKRIRKRRRNKT